MPPTVVIVDDNAGFRSCTRELLAGEGFDVVGHAPDGTTGLRELARLAPDVALLDVQLPDLDGFEIARRLRDGPAPPAVVLISGREEATYGDAVRACGARGFIAKADLCGDALRAVLGA